MKAWEMIKCLQEGRKFRHIAWGDRDYIYFDSERNKIMFCHDSQENVINEFQQLNNYLFNENVWEEYRESIEVGDWVVNIKTKEMFQITAIDNSGNNYGYHLDGLKGWYKLDGFRKATSNEIKQEQERRKWEKWGREVNQYKKGDIIGDYYGRIFQVIGDTDEYALVRNDVNDKLHVSQIMMVCPVEMRVDV